jgi:hypothetical protein
MVVRGGTKSIHKYPFITASELKRVTVVPPTLALGPVTAR